MTRTSTSMPNRIILQLGVGTKKTLLTKQALALKCLKRLKKNPSKIHVVRRDTVRYNLESCPEKLYFLWPEEIHHYVHTIRCYEKVSVSRLVCLAIDLYLTKILSILMGKAKRRNRYNKLLDAVFANVYRKVSFKHNHAIGLCTILIYKLAKSRISLPEAA